MIGANVVIQGTQTGSPTDIEGKFSINNVQPGTYTLVTSFITYKTKVIADVVVTAGSATEVNILLEEEAQQLDEIVVKGQADKSSENTLLLDRKASIGMVQGISSQELSRKGVGDAEAAVTQITGVTKQEGAKNVFVRGLGDRYNSTSLNGLPLPSEDPAYKNISLNFFSTDIIDNIIVNKTFTSDLSGDVGGANINIISKELFEEKELVVSASMGYNSQVSGVDFFRADGNNFLGTVDTDLPITDLQQYDFKNSFDANKLSGPLANSNFAIRTGRKFEIGNNALTVFAVGAMSSNYGYKEGREGFTNTIGQPRTDYTYKRYEYSATQFALANIGYKFGNDNRIDYNAFYIHDNKQYISENRGFSLNGVDDPNEPNAYDMFIKRQQTNNNILFVNQLISSFNLTDRITLTANGSFNVVRGDEPDRRQNWLIGDGTGENYRANNSSPQFNHRFYSTLKESEMAANIAASYKLKGESKIVVGYNTRITTRDFEYINYVFANPTGLSVDPSNLDAYFNQTALNNGDIVMETSRGKINNPKALIPFGYEGDRMINAGFVNIVYELTPALSVIAGSRFESFNQKVVWDVGADERRPNIPGDNTVERDKIYVLPSLNMKYDFSERDQLRFSASQTYTFPQFKEVAPFLYENPNYNDFGNPALRPSENLNFDLKFEHYFVGDGLVAVTGFYKQIKGAINRILVNSAALEYSFVNTGDATVFGGEVEFRKRLINLSRSNENTYLTTGVNISYLYADQSVRNDPSSSVQFDPSSPSTGLEGASPLLINADITFNKITNSGNRITSALVFNYFSERIAAIGTAGQENVMERGIPTIDWISKIDINSRLSVDVGVRNLLNPEYRLTKEIGNTGVDDLILSYKRGVISSIGFSYRF